jgi:SAM-dependent methyltransferase
MLLSVRHISIVLALIALGAAVFIYGIFPALMRAAIAVDPALAKDWRDRVLVRYQALARKAGPFTTWATFAWVFAYCKLLLDPMFDELPEFLESCGNFTNALDVGCGYGVSGAALLDWFPQAFLYGIDPDPARLRVARQIFATRGTVMTGAAPSLPADLPEKFDVILMLDVIHFLSPAQQEQTLRLLRRKLADGGHLILRSILPPAEKGSFAWRAASFRRGITGGYAFHQTADEIEAMIGRLGFHSARRQISGDNPELCWFFATACDSAEESAGRPPEPLAHAQ